MVVKEFIEMGEEQRFMEAILTEFSKGYRQTLTHLLVQIFKDSNDDRFHRFVPQVLASASCYVRSSDVVTTDTKLM